MKQTEGPEVTCWRYRKTEPSGEREVVYVYHFLRHQHFEYTQYKKSEVLQYSEVWVVKIKQVALPATYNRLKINTDNSDEEMRNPRLVEEWMSYFPHWQGHHANRRESVVQALQ